MKQKKKSSFQKLMGYAGKRKYLTYLSLVLAAISAMIALIPFYEIWRIIKEVLEVRPDFSQAVHIKTYGWYAVESALLSMLFYIAALMCSHLAAFRVQANMRIVLMEHIMKLPLGYVETEGTEKSGKSFQIAVLQQKLIWHITFRTRQFQLQHLLHCLQ